MMRILADMHVHTVLSPCASRDMIAAGDRAGSRAEGLAMIAVCDHNTAGNVEAVDGRSPWRAAPVQDADRAPLAVIAGMEITTAEEAHVLGLFPDAVTARARGRRGARGAAPVAAALVHRLRPRPCASPEQELVDAAGDLVGIEEKMLSAASRFTLSETVDAHPRHGGLAIAAHMDRRSFSVVSQLGFLPPGRALRRAGDLRGGRGPRPGRGVRLARAPPGQLLGQPLPGRPRRFPARRSTVEAPSFAELALALARREGQGVRDCVSSRCTSSTWSRTRSGQGRR